MVNGDEITPLTEFIKRITTGRIDQLIAVAIIYSLVIVFVTLAIPIAFLFGIIRLGKYFIRRLFPLEMTLGHITFSKGEKRDD